MPAPATEARLPPVPGDKRKADVALGQPLAPPVMAAPPVLGVPMLPPPITAATAPVLGQPLNGPPPLGPLPLFQPPAFVAAAAAAAAAAEGIKPEPAGAEAGGGEEEASASEVGAAGGGRKSRLVWTQELHNRFINALSHLVGGGWGGGVWRRACARQGRLHTPCMPALPSHGLPSDKRG